MTSWRRAGVSGRRARPAVADDLQRESLVDLAVGGRQPGEDEVGVRVHVDEPGRDHMTGGVDHPGRAGAGQEVDRLDAVPGDGHVGPPRGPAGAVDHGRRPGSGCRAWRLRLWCPAGHDWMALIKSHTVPITMHATDTSDSAKYAT